MMLGIEKLYKREKKKLDSRVEDYKGNDDSSINVMYADGSSTLCCVLCAKSDRRTL